MLRIKIHEIEKHRNETTFRPYINNRYIFEDIGIKFIFDGNNYDMVWVAQATYLRKSIPYSDCVNFGRSYVSRFPGDVILFDGQDSASLMGSWDIFKESSNCKRLIKNSLYSDRSLYKKPSVNGRIYWGSDVGCDYKIDEDIDWSRVILSGCNWLSTIEAHPAMRPPEKKDYDVCALFAYPTGENKEFGAVINTYYDAFRKKCIDEIQKLTGLRVATLNADGKKLPVPQYYDLMRRSKIVIAPFGYGEIAPRDLEASLFGSILIKPNMDHIETVPNIYVDNETYVACKWDFSDIVDKIEQIVKNPKNYSHCPVNFVDRFKKSYVPENLIVNTHNWISKIEGYE